MMDRRTLQHQYSQIYDLLLFLASILDLCYRHSTKIKSISQTIKTHDPQEKEDRNAELINLPFTTINI